MASEKITDLDALVTPDAADLLAIVDDVAGTPTTKKITLSDLSSIFSGDITINGTPVADQVVVWVDASTIEGDAGFTWDGSNLSATSFGGILEANLVDKSAAETIAGIWDFGVITATSYGGILEANLVDKSAAETVSGAWDFGLITATSYGGILEANLVDKSAAETIAGIWDFDSSVDFNSFLFMKGTAIIYQNPGATANVSLAVNATPDLVMDATGGVVDFNITGFTALNAGTVDADFDALTATSFGGITSANLLNKSATETVSGGWTFTGGVTFTSGNILGGTIDADFDLITGTRFGGILSSNLLDKSATETVGGTWSFSNQIVANNGIRMSDNDTISLGTSNDFTMEFDGTDLIMTSAVGAFDIVLTDLDLDLSGNTLISPVLKSHTVTLGFNGQVTDANINIAFSSGPDYFLDLELWTANRTITLTGAPSADESGLMTVLIRQDGTSARTITWAGGTFEWEGGTAHTMNSTLNGFSIFRFESWDEGSTWFGRGADYS